MMKPGECGTPDSSGNAWSKERFFRMDPAFRRESSWKDTNFRSEC